MYLQIKTSFRIEYTLEVHLLSVCALIVMLMLVLLLSTSTILFKDNRKVIIHAESVFDRRGVLLAYEQCLGHFLYHLIELQRLVGLISFVAQNKNSSCHKT